MKYKSTNGIEFAKAFGAVQYAMNSGVKVGICKNGNFYRGWNIAFKCMLHNIERIEGHKA